LKLIYSRRWRKSYLCLIILIIILLEFNLFVYYGIAKKDRYVSGYKKKTELKEGEEVQFHFSNNIHFGIKSEVNSSLEIEYNKNIENRETYLKIYNDNPISLQINVKRSMEDFGFSKNPNEPKKGEDQLSSDYKCIYKIVSNSSIDKIKFEFKKDFEYGLDPNIEYSIAVYEEDEKSWELLDTEDISDDSGIILKSSISDIEADKDYYITIYEVSYLVYVWIWGSIIAAIGIISLGIAISKTDFIHYLKTRSTPIEKGAHRLTLDEVLENENRNKIIDLILNEPGIHFNELLRRTELAAGNLVWHLDILETYKIIGKKRISNFIAYFLNYQKNPISNLDLRLSKSNLTLEILKMIEKEPGIWNSIITQRQKVDHKTIHYHISKLIDLELVTTKKEGRKKKLFPNLDSDYFNADIINKE
jgi:predicted transcriptional regulator